MGFFENLKIKSEAKKLGFTIDEYNDYLEAEKYGISADEYRRWIKEFKKTLTLEEFGAFCKALKVKGEFYIDYKPHITEPTALEYAKNHKRISLDMFLRYCDREHCYAEAGFGILGGSFQYDAYILYLDKNPIIEINDDVCQDAEKFIIEYSKKYVREHSVIKDGVLKEYYGELYDLVCIPDEVHTVDENALNKPGNEDFKTYNLLFHNSFKSLGFSDYVSINDFTTFPYKEKRLQEAMWKYKLPDSMEYIADYDEFSFGSTLDTIIAPISLKGCKVLKGRKVKWVGEVKKAKTVATKEAKSNEAEINGTKDNAVAISSKDDNVDNFYNFGLGSQTINIDDVLAISIPNSFVFGKNIVHKFKNHFTNKMTSLTYDFVMAFNDNYAKLDGSGKSTLELEVLKGEPLADNNYDFSSKNIVDEILGSKVSSTRGGNSNPKKVIGKKDLYIEFASGLRLFDSSEYDAVILNKNNYYMISIYFNYEGRKITHLKKATEESIVKSMLKTIKVLSEGEAEELSNAYVPAKKASNIKFEDINADVNPAKTSKEVIKKLTQKPKIDEDYSVDNYNSANIKSSSTSKVASKNNDIELIIEQLKSKYADYPAYALRQVEMECKDISLSKLKKWLKETQSKTLGVYLQEIGVIDAYKHSQVMEARKKEEKEIREQQKKDFAANLENNKSYDDCESNLIFVDSEYDQLKICENFDNVQKFATVKTESGATLELRVGEKVSVSDNSEYALPLDKKVVQFFKASYYYIYILFEDGRIRSVKLNHPRTEITVWKSIAADIEQLSDIKDFLVFEPLMCGLEIAPCIVIVYTNGTVSIIKGKKSAEQYDSVLNKVASATNVEHVFEFNGDLAVFFKDGQIKIWGSGKDALSKYKFNFVKYLTNSDYLITTDNSYVLVHGSMGIIHELKNTVKIIYDSYNLYFLTDKHYFSETGWREKDEKNKTFNQKGTIKDFWVKKAYSEDPKIVVLYDEGYAITSNGFSKFNVINNVSGVTYENGKMCLYISNNKEAVLSVEQKSDFSVEKIKKHSLQTLEQIYRRLGQRKYYYQGTSGLFEIRISELDYELLEQDPLFAKYMEKAQNYAASALNQLRNPFRKSVVRTASFENAAIFQWEDIVSVVELAYFINMYNVPSFTMELYLAESEYDKPFCFTITNKEEYFKIKTKRV